MMKMVPMVNTSNGFAAVFSKAHAIWIGNYLVSNNHCYAQNCNDDDRDYNNGSDIDDD